jgi:uncharacterized protein (DUF1330 family)
VIYILAQLRIHQRDVYERYVQRFMATLAGTQGRLLAADESPIVVEGAWDRDKVVLIAFPDEDAFRAWESSAAYQAITGDRRAGADTSIILIRGFG